MAKPLPFKQHPHLGATFAWNKDGSPFPPSTIEHADVTYADITPPGSATFTVTATAEGGACAITSPNFVMTSNVGQPRFLSLQILSTVPHV